MGALALSGGHSLHDRDLNTQMRRVGGGACEGVKLAARAGYSRSAESACVSMGATRRIGGAFAWNSSRSSEPRTTRSSWRPSRVRDSRSPSTTCCASSCARRAENGRRERRRESSEPPRDPGPHPRRAVRRRGRELCSARASRTSPASRAPCSPSASTSSDRRSPCPCCSAPTSRATRTRPSAPRCARKLAEAGAERRAVDQLEGADRLDRQARVHGERCRPRRALELRASPQHPLAAELRRDPALAPGLAARGADPAAARARDGRRRRTTPASTAAPSARAACPRPISSRLRSPRRPPRRSSRPRSSAPTRPS